MLKSQKPLNQTQNIVNVELWVCSKTHNIILFSMPGKYLEYRMQYAKNTRMSSYIQLHFAVCRQAHFSAYSDPQSSVQQNKCHIDNNRASPGCPPTDNMSISSQLLVFFVSPRLEQHSHF